MKARMYGTRLRALFLKDVLWLLLLLLGGIDAKAVETEIMQKGVISGTIIDEKGEPVIGASILVKGSTVGATTDIDGKFTLSVPDDESVTLVISSIGYQKAEIRAKAGKSIRFILKEDVEILDEVVVVGYGTQRKKDLTGAVGVVDVKEMKKMNAPNIGQALQGQVAGVSVSTSGEPGSSADVRIRGIGSFSNVGPLYVIDGMIINGSQREFNVNDIESMQVLKDASATALYGARGANGVIIITTKKGKEGPTRIEASANFGVQQIAKRIEMMNSLEFLKINRLAYENADMEWPGEPEQGQILTNTDWQDEFFKLGTTQDYNLTLSGGNMNGNYLVSGNFFKQDGVVEGPWHKRYSLRVNTGYKKGIFTFGENMLVSRTETRPMTGTSFIDLLRMPPVIPVYDDTKAGGYGTGSTQSQTYGTNPIGQQETRDYRQTSNRIIGNVFAELEFFKCLKLKTNLGVEYHNWFDREKETYKQIRYLEVSNYDNQLLERKGDFTTIISENTLNFNKKFGKHSIEALLGYTAEKTQWKQHEASVKNLTEGYWVLSAGKTEPSVTGTDSDYAMTSILGRVNYAYADKYLFQFNIRRDGSSRFGKNYRYGTFPSFSLGWRMSEERFFTPVKNVIDDLKLRTSYGVIGDQQAIGDYDYATYITVGEGAIFGPDQTFYPGAIQKGRANPNLRWEQKATFNIGVDFSMFDQHFYGSVEYFNSKSKDLLVKLPISWTEGTDITPWSNYGKLKNTGVEINLGYRETKRAFKYNIGLNLSHVKNEVLELGESFREGGTNGVNRSEKGRSVGDFYVIKTNGIFQSWDEVYAHTTTVTENGQTITKLIQPDAHPGDIRYIDANNDGKIDKDDRQYVGSPLPKFEMGITFSAEYKNFDFSLFMTGVFGNKIYNVGKYWLERMDETSNYPKDLKPWTEENHSTTTPRPVIGTTDNTLAYTDRWIERGDYFRIKNLQVGYTFKDSWLKKTKFIGSARLYVSAQNLWTITGYSGYDPEISGGDVFGQGNDNGHFPPVRTFSIGAQVSF